MNRLPVLADQIVYSLGTFITSILLARQLSVNQFGLFTLFFTAIVLAIGFQRAILSEPLLIVTGKATATREVLSRARWGTLLIGGIAALACSAVMWLLTPEPLSILLGVALIGPFIQDTVRNSLLVTAGPVAMLTSDVLSTTAQITAIAVAGSYLQLDYRVSLAVWGAAAFLGPVLVGWRVARSAENKKSAAAVERYKALHIMFGLDYLLGVTSLQGTLIAATTVGGLASSAALRGADALIGPFRVLLQSLPQLLLRRWSASTTAKSRVILRLAFPVSITATVAAAVTAFLPTEIGSIFMGKSWQVVQPVLPFVVLSLAPITLTFIATLAIKAAEGTRMLIGARLVATPVTLVAGISGALLAGAEGAAIGSLIGSIMAALIFFSFLRRIERAPHSIEHPSHRSQPAERLPELNTELTELKTEAS